MTNNKCSLKSIINVYNILLFIITIFKKCKKILKLFFYFTPVLNNKDKLKRTIDNAKSKFPGAEIIVVDGVLLMEQRIHWKGKNHRKK